MSAPPTTAAPTSERVQVERWPTEEPLLVFVLLAALSLWLLLAVSIIGLVYVLLIGLVLFVAQVVFVAHVRGSAVRLSARQLPELHRRVQELAARAGLARPPEAYLMQAEGALNALATRFLGASVIVLFSDLLEACGSDEKARDMVIGHELGHLASGHLRWRWLVAPGLFVPFLGQPGRAPASTRATAGERPCAATARRPCAASPCWPPVAPTARASTSRRSPARARPSTPGG